MRSALLRGFLSGISQGCSMSVSSCAPPRLVLGDHSLNALCLRRRDPKNAGSLCEAWKRGFNCDLTAHVALTVDRLKRICNLVTHGVPMERLCCLRDSQQYLRAFSNGIKVVAEKYFAVLKNSYETILIVQFRALNIFHRMELSWLGFNQRQPAMLGILARISIIVSAVSVEAGLETVGLPLD